jgi:nucleoside-diphosphate-sugar epimerase
MRVLFTGVTSFTGVWFAHALAAAGHAVTAAIRGGQDSHTGLPAERLALLKNRVALVWDQPFGSDAFLATIAGAGPFDILCHHAADATNYKSPDFDAMAAVAANCRELPRVLTALKARGCGRIVLTGSVFEAHEGRGTTPLTAFSPYGLSKTLTSETFRYYAAREGFCLGKFVIPNPFGPYEKPLFTNYLVDCWRHGKVARVNTPDYVRDNIPVSLLALAYADFVAALPQTGFHKLSPSCYAESQGDFAARFAREVSPRLGIAAPLELAVQADFPEPVVRVNTDRVVMEPARWQESVAWDQVADYYRAKFAAAA